MCVRACVCVCGGREGERETLTQNFAIIALLLEGLILWLPHGDVFVFLA